MAILRERPRTISPASKIAFLKYLRKLIWPQKVSLTREIASRKTLAEPGLKIESLASVNKTTAFSDSLSNVHSVVYLANMGMWKMQRRR